MSKKNYKIFGDNIDPKALAQFHEARKLDGVEQGAVMPDAHLGYALNIGGVLATRGMVVPSWVGYDIGCGVSSIRTSMSRKMLERVADEVYEETLNNIPVGRGGLEWADKWINITNKKPTAKGREIYSSAGGDRSMGTLGGGNHFIEYGYDSKNVVWVTVHSGSRKVGHDIAQFYMDKAKPEYGDDEGNNPLGLSTKLGRDYVQDAEFCEIYAIANRRRMLAVIQKLLFQLYGTMGSWSDIIECNHNHLDVYGTKMIHRKGATKAYPNTRLVIPGTMRDGVIIAEGLGNPDSLFSCSHGAGRVLSRSKAKKKLTVSAFEKEMKGIKCNVSQDSLDESPMAYKHIHTVMDAQKSCVRRIDIIKPLVNIKG
jgi:tRNA-splicing ligase RtcB